MTQASLLKPTRKTDAKYLRDQVLLAEQHKTSAADSAATATTQAGLATNQAGIATAGAQTAVEAATTSTDAANLAVEAAGKIFSNSSTSNTIGNGSKTFTTGTGLSYVAGSLVTIYYREDSAAYMEGEINSYNSTTGELIVDVTSNEGAGTYDDWVIVSLVDLVISALRVKGNFILDAGEIYAPSDTKVYLGGEGRLRFIKDGKTDAGGGDQFFFGDYAAWSSAHSDADIGLSNNFHAWWGNNDPVRVEFEADQGEMQFYIEGGVGSNAWYGLQEGATHHWSFGSVAGGNFKFCSGFGLNGAVSLQINKSNGKVSVPQGFSGPITVINGSAIDDLHKPVAAHRTFGIFQQEDAVLQIASENTGNVGTGLILTGQQSASDGRHWVMQHTGGLKSNRFTLGYAQTTETGENILIDAAELLTITTDGNIGIGGVTDPSERLELDGNFALSDGSNIIAGSTTGTKIGTSSSQKLGFFNATPVVQQSSTGETSGVTQNSGTDINDSSTFTGGIGSTAYTISDIVKHLKTLGLIAE